MQRYHVAPGVKTGHFDVVDFVTGKPCFMLDQLPQEVALQRCRTLNEGYRTIRKLVLPPPDETR